jgi:cytoskeletal protein RodZ
LTQYKINSPIPTDHSHRFLIGPPLFVISLFCFGFVLMQPHHSTQDQTASSHPASKNTSTKLPPIQSASPASLTKLSQDSTASDTTQASTTSSSSSTTASSTTNTPVAKTTATATLQAGTSNSQPANSSPAKPIVTKVTSLVNSLKLTH